jgi:hypothetical protein
MKMMSADQHLLEEKAWGLVIVIVNREESLVCASSITEFIGFRWA